MRNPSKEDHLDSAWAGYMQVQIQIEKVLGMDPMGTTEAWVCDIFRPREATEA